ncbi:virulence-associated E family protein [uncultured Acidaminococcus sp.]|uniref:virulence-associated E family protein n=1 Tax=uncultured Acidaminococcus sp. TaxID=352152 RepID=UPI0026DC5BB7|nr:virulence-associated E family protein [uncultured Acidaminococcus sp.]
MINDRMIRISVGQSKNSTNWTGTDLLWSAFVERLRTPFRTEETFDAYIHMPKAQQGALKDVGGFVGGSLQGHRRKASAVTGRDLVTLDLDTIPAGDTDTILRRVGSLGIAYAVYSTRSHSPMRPRLRVVLPLDRTVTADEYEPIARRLGAVIGIEHCDPTTFEPSRLMFWPSCSKDSQYVFASDDQPFTSADGILAQYDNWRDVQSWPTVPGKELQARVTLTKQANPTEKPGIVGAFCRVYDIRKALDKYLPNAYADTDHADRLTYTGGTTVAGAVLYDDGKFLYSHHATDPCCDQLVNAFDLVRIHVFGDRDGGAVPGTPVNKMPSYIAMKRLAMQDQDVLQELNRTYAQEAANIFQDMGAAPGDAPADTQTDAEAVDWMPAAKLDNDPNTGRPKKTMDNIIRILNYDPLLKGKVAIDDFSTRGLVLGKLPWSHEEGKRLWTDTDDAGINWYLEVRHGITGRDKISGALMLVSEQHKFNEVKDYLNSLTWDGVPRVATVLRDYLGAEDNDYVRAVARKSFAAAVARVMTPGCKYDYVPVFVGPQGIGKTTFLKTIGKDWHSDSLQSFKGKEAAEMIQGIWINEIGEMTGYNKSEDDVIKQFLSRCDDVYRQPYGRHTGRYPRKGVFFGTCNNHDFLKDPTGSRRFWPVDVGVRMPSKNIWKALPGEVDQLWAEAVQLWKQGEPLYMNTPKLDSLAKQAQAQHREDSVKEGMIQDFLEKEVPGNYDSLSLNNRRMFWAGNYNPGENIILCPREKVCALEIWCECFNGDPKSMRRADAVEINQILANTPGWVRVKSPRRYGYCGNQRGFERPTE